MTAEARTAAAARRPPASGARLRRGGRVGEPHPRDGGLRGPHPRARQRARRRTGARSTSSARASRSARSRPPTSIAVDLDADYDHVREGMHLETVLHTEVYKRRPDVRSVVHGHPPYATAFGATDAEFQYLTHDSVLFVGGISTYDGVPDLIMNARQGAEVAQALGDGTALLLRNHGVLIAERDVQWAVLASVLLERAVQMQSIAGPLGPLQPIPQELLPAIHAASTRPTSRASTGTPGCASCAAAGAPSACRGRLMARERRDRDRARPSTATRSRATRRRRPSCCSTSCASASACRREALLRRAGLRHLHRARRRRPGERVHLPRGRDARARGADRRGLRADRRVRGVRAAFMRHAALQCGYCTPGLLLTLKSLRDAGELRTEEDILHGLDGSICRCTGYRSILEAARDLAGIGP